MKKYILVSFVLLLVFYGIFSDKANGQIKSQLLCDKAKQNLAKKWTATNVKNVQKYCGTSSVPTTQQNTQPQQPQSTLQPQQGFIIRSLPPIGTNIFIEDIESIVKKIPGGTGDEYRATFTVNVHCSLLPPNKAIEPLIYTAKFDIDFGYDTEYSPRYQRKEIKIDCRQGENYTNSYIYQHIYRKRGGSYFIAKFRLSSQYLKGYDSKSVIIRLQ